MQSSRLYKASSPLLVGLALLLAIGITIGVIQSGLLTRPSSTIAKSDIKAQSKKAASVVSEKEDSSFTNYKKLPISSFGRKVESLEKAMEQVSHKPKLPDSAVAGNPAQVYVIDTLPPDDKGICIQYPNGIQMWIYPNKKEVPDYDYLVEESSDLKIVNINGFKGMAGEPGKQSLGISGEVAVPGAVCWYENGTEYQIYGDNVSLNKLLPIASSVR